MKENIKINKILIGIHWSQWRSFQLIEKGNLCQLVVMVKNV